MSMPAERVTAAKTVATLLDKLADAPAVPVRGIASDSRLVTAGGLFLACAGSRAHGIDYLDDVLRAGAAAVAWDSSTAKAPVGGVPVPMIGVPALADHLGAIANRYYDSPAEAVRVFGVTGTNGKTSVAWLLAQAFEHVGSRCAYVGTLGSGMGSIETGSDMTTPGAVELIGRLADFRDRGAACAAIEVSSHAIAQNRIDGIGFEAVMFTNLTRDHLDYHGDMQSYFEAKARLFTESPARHRIINVDSEFGAVLAARCGEGTVAVSTDKARASGSGSYVCVSAAEADAGGSRIQFESSWGGGGFYLPLPGDFNVANAALVLAGLLVAGVSVSEAANALGQVTAPPGRLQRVPGPEGTPAVYVDYAHTPDALGVVLSALRRHCRGRLWCVFGCGGERDTGKRPLMADVAERGADRVVVTTDNPRRESASAIISDIVSGLVVPDRATVIEDRAAAIAWAIAAAGEDDVVLLAGKGHEEYQAVGTERRPFSDFRLAQANLQVRAGANR